ncbi:MAG: 3-dehydroquinate synthase [Bacteroidota bacterium]
MKVIFDKNYKVFFGSDVLSHLAQSIIQKSYSQVFVLVDENTEKFCLPVLKPYLEKFTLIRMKSGEHNKNLEQATIIWNTLQKNLANRNSVLLNFGGGTLSDLGGFCASTYKRGIDFINIPTTLLAMVDASIGGKQGIDLNNYKNLIGVFNHPTQVFIYPQFIETLSAADKRNGLAELLKHALIDDKELFEKLIKTSQIDYHQIEKFIEKSTKIKIKIVNKDPYEKGLRKMLNFGHTIGHAIETYSLINDAKPLKHGEAIAIGIICESYLSNKMMKLSNSDLDSIVKFIQYNFEKYGNQWRYDDLITNMHHDKKNNTNQINFTLLKKLGKAEIDCHCSTELIIESLQFYESLSFYKS